MKIKTISLSFALLMLAARAHAGAATMARWDYPAMDLSIALSSATGMAFEPAACSTCSPQGIVIVTPGLKTQVFIYDASDNDANPNHVITAYPNVGLWKIINAFVCGLPAK